MGRTNDKTTPTLLTKHGPFNILQIILHVSAHFYRVTISQAVHIPRGFCYFALYVS